MSIKRSDISIEELLANVAKLDQRIDKIKSEINKIQEYYSTFEIINYRSTLSKNLMFCERQKLMFEQEIERLMESMLVENPDRLLLLENIKDSELLTEDQSNIDNIKINNNLSKRAREQHHDQDHVAKFQKLEKETFNNNSNNTEFFLFKPATCNEKKVYNNGIIGIQNLTASFTNSTLSSIEINIEPITLESLLYLKNVYTTLKQRFSGLFGPAVTTLNGKIIISYPEDSKDTLINYLKEICNRHISKINSNINKILQHIINVLDKATFIKSNNETKEPTWTTGLVEDSIYILTHEYDQNKAKNFQQYFNGYSRFDYQFRIEDILGMHCYFIENTFKKDNFLDGLYHFLNERPNKNITYGIPILAAVKDLINKNNDKSIPYGNTYPIRGRK